MYTKTINKIIEAEAVPRPEITINLKEGTATRGFIFDNEDSSGTVDLSEVAGLLTGGELAAVKKWLRIITAKTAKNAIKMDETPTENSFPDEI